MHLKYKTNHVIKYWNATGSTERTTIEIMALSFKKKILLTLYSRRKIYNIKSYRVLVCGVYKKMMMILIIMANNKTNEKLILLIIMR